MSSAYQPLTPALTEVNEAGHLASRQYGDVYNSPADAYGQAVDVFLHGNDLPQRWRGRRHFTVCETGFWPGHEFSGLVAGLAGRSGALRAFAYAVH